MNLGLKTITFEFAGTESKRKILPGLKPKNTIIVGTKFIFKPSLFYP